MIDFQILDRAAHHLYADRADLFNAIVNDVCDEVDKKESIVTETIPDRKINSSERQQSTLQADKRQINRLISSPSTPNFTGRLSKSEESLSHF